MNNNDFNDKNNETANDKMTFSEHIVYAILKPAKYKDLIQLRTRSFVGFVIVMMLVVTIITFVVPTGAVIAGFGGFESLFTKRLGSFTFSDGELEIERPFEMSFNAYNVLINTDEKVPTDDMLRKDGIYIALGSEKLRMTTVVGDQIVDYQTMELKLIFPEGLSNKDLVDNIPIIYTSLVFTAIFTAVGNFVKYGFYALILSIMANSLSKRMELGLSYGKVFKVCFYGVMPSMLLYNCSVALGFNSIIILGFATIFITVNMISKALITMDMARKGSL